MEVEDGLAAARSNVDDDAVILEPSLAGRVGDELEHPLRLVLGELAHVTEGLHVPLGDDEEVRLGLRVDVPDRHEAVAGADVVTFAIERAEEALRQRGSPPP